MSVNRAAKQARAAPAAAPQMPFGGFGMPPFGGMMGGQPPFGWGFPPTAPAAAFAPALVADEGGEEALNTDEELERIEEKKPMSKAYVEIGRTACDKSTSIINMKATEINARAQQRIEQASCKMCR